MRIKDALHQTARNLLTPPVVRHQIKAERERAQRESIQNTNPGGEQQLGLMVFAGQEDFAQEEEIIEGEIAESNIIYSLDFFNSIAPTQELSHARFPRLCVWMIKNYRGESIVHTRYSPENVKLAAYQLVLALNVDFTRYTPLELVNHIESHLRESRIDSIAITQNGGTTEIKIAAVLRDLNRLATPVYFSRTKHEITHQQVLQILEQHFGPRS